MRLFTLCLLIFSGSLACQESDQNEENSLAKSSFPVRLTQEEQEEHEYRLMHPELHASPTPPHGCCNHPEPNACVAPCCRPPSINCPPVHPQFDACDCIMDFFNPIVFNGFDLYVEWLFWKVQQKSTYVLTPHRIPQPVAPSLNADSIGKYRAPDFDWRSGLRLGLGYTFHRDAWKLLGQYTYYGTSGSDSANRSDNLMFFLQPTVRAITTSPTGIDRVRCNTDFDYQVFDFLLSRRFLPGTQILFEFFAGPTAAVITEKIKVESSDVLSANPVITTTTKNHWSFSSGGMRVGFDATWSVGRGWGLYNKSSFATLVGAYKNKRETSISAVVPNLLFPHLRRTKQEEAWVVPATQLEFGVNWNRQFCHWAIQIQAAFEVNTWYDLHQLHQDAQGAVPSNLDHLDYRNASPVSLWGTSFRANFSF